MQPIYTFNDTSIEIQIIEKGCYYKANIPNNDINKKLIENPKSNFKFDKCGSGIIMHDDIHVFQLSKTECNYSDYIDMKDQLEHLKKENDILKQELSKNEKEMINFKNEILQQMKNDMVNFKKSLNDINNLLQKQIEKVNDKSVKYTKDLHQQIKYYLPFVLKIGSYDITHYGNEQIVTFSQDHYPVFGPFFNSQKDVKFIKNLLPSEIYTHIIIPPGKVLITLPIHEYSLKVYNKGNHYNIKLGDITMLINEKNFCNIIDLYKKEQAVKIFGNLRIEYLYTNHNKN